MVVRVVDLEIDLGKTNANLTELEATALGIFNRMRAEATKPLTVQVDVATGQLTDVGRQQLQSQAQAQVGNLDRKDLQAATGKFITNKEFAAIQAKLVDALVEEALLTEQINAGLPAAVRAQRLSVEEMNRNAAVNAELTVAAQLQLAADRLALVGNTELTAARVEAATNLNLINAAELELLATDKAAIEARQRLAAAESNLAAQKAEEIIKNGPALNARARRAAAENELANLDAAGAAARIRDEEARTGSHRLRTTQEARLATQRAREIVTNETVLGALTEKAVAEKVAADIRASEVVKELLINSEAREAVIERAVNEQKLAKILNKEALVAAEVLGLRELEAKQIAARVTRGLVGGGAGPGGGQPPNTLLGGQRPGQFAVGGLRSVLRFALPAAALFGNSASN